MELSSLQVCMDTSNWLQEQNGTNSSSSSPSGDMMTCSRPLETRLRPPTDQLIKCPRCDSARTKFCYYNNYSLSQPRYFCKTCRRYWTKGGSLRNIPVGGGCRKNKRVIASKKQNEKPSNHCHSHSTSSPDHHPTGFQLSFPDVQFSHLSDLLGNSAILGNTSFMEIGGGGGGGGYNAMLENSDRQQNQYFMESKFDEILGNTRSHDFMGINDSGLVDGLGDFDNHPNFTHSFHGFCSSAGVSSLTEMETSQRIMLPFEGADNAREIKPTKLLSLDLVDHGCNSDAGKDSIGYLDNLGSWNAVMHGYGSSATFL